MRAVVDTNVIVSRYLTPGGLAAQVFSDGRTNRLELVVSEALLSEIHEVLLRPAIKARHQLTETQLSEIVANFRWFATVVEPTEKQTVCADPDDDMFLECALAGGADVVVSRDPHLLQLKECRGIRIMTPAVFLALLEAEEGETP